MPATKSIAHRKGRPRVVPPVTTLTPAWLWLAWTCLAVAVVTLFGVWPVSGGDLFMHLMLGRYTWAHLDVPRVDLFSYVSYGHEFVAHSWLSEVLFYVLE